MRELRAAGVHDVVTETTSGAGRRPALDALVADLGAGDELVIVSLDRLGRVGASLLALVYDLTARGVGLRATRQQINTSDPVAGRITLYVLAALAEAEKGPHRRAHPSRPSSSPCRRPPRRPPYRHDPDRLRIARQLVADGETIAAASRVIGVSRSTLGRHLTA